MLEERLKRTAYGSLIRRTRPPHRANPDRGERDGHKDEDPPSPLRTPHSPKYHIHGTRKGSKLAVNLGEIFLTLTTGANGPKTLHHDQV
jgi:hypothetical protein